MRENPARVLPDPAPGLISLVGLHLRLTLREARIGSVLVGALTVGLPIAGSIVAVRQSAGADLEELVAFGAAISALSGLAILVALLWPESVWRQLPRGKRWVLDTLPVGRRSHRMARVMAGSVVPLALVLSLILTAMLLPADAALHPLVHDVGPLGASAVVIAILGAYLFSSILALSLGQVLRPLFYGAILLMLLPLPFQLAGAADTAQALWSTVTGHTLSPIRLTGIGMGLQGTPADLAPALLWLVIFGGVAVHLAGRHDRV